MGLTYYICIALMYLWVFLVGLCIGSFLNVIIWRIPQGISIAKGRSFCPKCGHMIRAYDNIPVISWLILKGKCRDCHEPISVRYPCVELLTGICFVVVFLRYGFNLHSVMMVLATAVLICIAYIDHDTMTIPNTLVCVLMVIAMATYFTQSAVGMSYGIADRLIGMVCISIPLLLITLLVPGAFGGGDMKLMVAAGFMLGWERSLVATFIALVIAGIYAVYLMVSGKIKRGAHIAFGPYLAIGIWVSELVGIWIIAWYVGMFWT